MMFLKLPHTPETTTQMIFFWVMIICALKSYLTIEKCAPEYPPNKDPIMSIGSQENLISPLKPRSIAPVLFQKNPTAKSVWGIAWEYGILNRFTSQRVTRRPVPEEIEPFKKPRIKITNVNNFCIFFISSWSSNFYSRTWTLPCGKACWSKR